MKLLKLPLNESSNTWCTVRPNKLKHWNWEQRNVYCRTMQGDGWFMPPKILNSLKDFSKAFLKPGGKGAGLQSVWSAHAQFSDWLMVKKQDGVTRVNITSPEAPGRLGALCHSVEGFHICETARKCTLHTLISMLRRGDKAKDYGERSHPGKAR